MRATWSIGGWTFFHCLVETPLATQFLPSPKIHLRLHSREKGIALPLESMPICLLYSHHLWLHKTRKGKKGRGFGPKPLR